MINYLQTAPSPPVLPRLDPLTLLVAPQNPAPPNTQSLAEFVIGFFAHYAELPMHLAVCVATASHVPRPGSWTFERFCILDPLTPDEDLGRNLTPKTLPMLRRELARAARDLQTSGDLLLLFQKPETLPNKRKPVR